MIKKAICLLAMVTSIILMHSCFFKHFDPLYTFNYHIENKIADSVQIVAYNAWNGQYEIHLDSSITNYTYGSLKRFTLQPGQKVLSSWEGYSQVYNPMLDESVDELLQGVCDSIIFIRYPDSSQVTYRNRLSIGSHENVFFDLKAWTIEKQTQWESICIFQITNELFDNNKSNCSHNNGYYIQENNK